MKRRHLAAVEFAANIPRELDAGVLYVSMEHSTAIHSCMCGCGHEVVTPFGRRSWSVTYDGEGVSLWPSIGNAALPCRSHYILRDNKILWLEKEEHRALPQLARERPSPFSRLAAWLDGKFSADTK